MAKKKGLPMGRGRERAAREKLLEEAVKILDEQRSAVCRGCGKPLEREQRSRHLVWYVCHNLFCVKNQKEPVTIGNVIIGNRPKGKK